jgi:hypothetical protein
MRHLRAAFLGLATVHVASLALDVALLPYAGSAALAALLGWALFAGADRAVGVGLAALTAAAVLMDARSGGYGWPAVIGSWGSPGPAEAAPLAVGGVAFALAIGRVVELPVRRWRLFVAAGAWLLAALLFLAALIAAVTNATAWRDVHVHPLALAMAVPGAVALLLSAVAALAWAGRRGIVAAAAVPLVVLLTTAAGTLPHNDAFEVRPRHEASVSFRVDELDHSEFGWTDYGGRLGELPSSATVDVPVPEETPADLGVPPITSVDLWSADWSDIAAAVAALAVLTGLVVLLGALLPPEPPELRAG